MNRRAIVLVNTTAILCGLLVGVAPAEAGFVTYTDRTAFLAALGFPVAADGYEPYDPGDIVNGSTLGDFQYTFGGDVQPSVVPGAFGGNALGGAPFEVFIGGDLVSLTFPTPTLRAFGADFYYGPWFGAVPSDIYRIRIDDGSGAGMFVGNPDGLDVLGGTFFLGVLADPGSEFGAISLLSHVPTDDSGEPILVSAYQVDNLVYGTAATVPDQSSSLVLLMIGSGVLAAFGRTFRLYFTAVRRG